MLAENPARVARCLFCGHAGTWWQCTCDYGRRIRCELKPYLPKPKTRMVDGVPVIECCEELREAAKKAGVMTRIVDVSISVTPGGRSVTADKLRTCVVCGKPFLAKREDAKICSGACRMKAQRHPKP